MKSYKKLAIQITLGILLAGTYSVSALASNYVPSNAVGADGKPSKNRAEVYVPWSATNFDGYYEYKIINRGDILHSNNNILDTMPYATWYKNYGYDKDSYYTTFHDGKDTGKGYYQYQIAGGFVYGIEVNGKQILNLNPYSSLDVKDGNGNKVKLPEAQPDRVNWRPWDQVEYYATLDKAAEMVAQESENRVYEDNRLHMDDVAKHSLSFDNGMLTSEIVLNDATKLWSSVSISDYVGKKIYKEAGDAIYNQEGDTVTTIKQQITKNTTNINTIKNDYVIHVDETEKTNVDNVTNHYITVNQTVNGEPVATEIMDRNTRIKSVIFEWMGDTERKNALHLKIEDTDGNDFTQVVDGIAKASDLESVQALAGKHTKVTVNGGTEAPTTGYTGGNLQLAVSEIDGQKVYDVKLNNTLNLGDAGSVTVGNTVIQSNSIAVGNTTINGDGLTIAGDNTHSSIIINQNQVSMGGNQIHNVAAGKELTDAVNVSQLHQYVNQEITAKDIHVDTSKSYSVNKTTNKINVDVVNSEKQLVISDVAAASDVGNVNNLHQDLQGSESNPTTVVEAVNKVYDEAKKHTTVSVDGNIEGATYTGNGNLQVAEITGANGGKQYDLRLNKDIDLGTDGSLKTGNTTVNNAGLIIKGDTEGSDITINQGNISFGGNQIHNVAAGTELTDAVNLGQLKEVEALAGKHTVVTVNGGTVAPSDGSYSDGNLQLKVTETNGQKTYDLKLNDNLNIGGGNGGIITVKGPKGDTGEAGKDGVVIKADGDGGHIVINGKDGADGAPGASADMTVVQGPAGVAGVDGETMTRVEYKDQDGGTHQVATLDDGMKYMGDVGTELKTPLNTQVKVVGGVTDASVLIGGNIGVVSNAENNTLEVKMNKDINLGKDGSLKVGDKVTIDKNGIDAGDTKITNVAPGEISATSKDAINGSQLHAVEQKVEQNAMNINNLNGRVNKLDNRINKVGAGAAALAALHPLEFDPDEKFSVSAGYGNYRGENAGAVGVFYQPNDDTLFSLGATAGNGENMVNAGLTLRFGQNSNQSRSKKAMAKEIIDLRTELVELKAIVHGLTGQGLDIEKTKVFPDTPENHWAYDYVAALAGNGLLEGYPDGYFKGDRQLTRYEMAAVIYRLMSKGVDVDKRMLKEFANELARVRVDTLTSHKDGTPSIQRVRVIEGRG